MHAIPLILALLTSSTALFFGNDINGAMTIMSWFTYYLTGYIIASCLGLKAVRIFLVQIRNIVIFGCLFGIVFQYFGGFAFASDSFLRGQVEVAGPLIFRLGDSFGYRMSSIFSHPIVFADLIVIAICITICFEKNRFLRVTILMVLFVGLFGTQTRGAWVALALIGCALVLRFKSVLANSLSAIVLALPLILLVALFVQSIGVLDSVAERFANITGDASYTTRIGTIGEIASSFISRPDIWLFGGGYGSAGHIIAVSNIGGTQWGVVDNQYMTMLFDFGVLPTVIFGFAVLTIFFHSGLKLSDVEFVVLVGITGSCLIGMFFYELFTWPSIAMLFFSAIGITNASQKTREGRKIYKPYRERCLYTSGHDYRC